MRDDFTSKAREVLARRVNSICSNPECGLATFGPHTDADKAVNKGVAAHIAAVAPGGKRYDVSMTTEERSSAGNGIWLCQNCAKLIDSDEERFSVEVLQIWKRDAESKADRSIHANSPLGTPAPKEPDISVSYADGKNGTCASLTIFNNSSSARYLCVLVCRLGQ
jgi:hypothetical protein